MYRSYLGAHPSLVFVMFALTLPILFSKSARSPSSHTPSTAAMGVAAHMNNSDSPVPSPLKRRPTMGQVCCCLFVNNSIFALPSPSFKRTYVHGRFSLVSVSSSMNPLSLFSLALPFSCCLFFEASYLTLISCLQVSLRTGTFDIEDFVIRFEDLRVMLCNVFIL